ncbi:helix-turn-helix transcriptional regulator [Lactobacillus sp. ESL0679]|uniref:helix-turn-helix domain-containing protein n=1 Tax=Lactobacillus sp. ESL0679 TaxID=2983209 RepID=UPI0023F9BFE6|nr:helix-turn-helix transcriptional regulator [Lactobacillus sp. ESL0679]MDF7683367.1 helix-turn-helix transcriptional regulator [Lactobacillus sp. ESL0679]
MTVVFDNVKKLAKKYGYSLQKVAEKAGIGTNAIYGWKRYNPSPDSLSKVAKVLHTTPEYLQGVKPTSKDDELTWQDFGMAYGGRIPDDLKDMYDALAEQYVKNHPEVLKDTFDEEDDELDD